MIGPSGNVRVYLACGADMRRGIAGLSALVEAVIKEAPGSGAIFGFRVPRQTQPITNILHTVFVLRRSHILGIRCSGERCRSRRIGAARA